MNLEQIEAELTAKRAEVAEIMRDIHDTLPKSPARRELSIRHLEISKDLQALKDQKSALWRAMQKDGMAPLKVVVLHHPTDRKVTYYACELSHFEMLLQLEEVYGDEKPAVTFTFNVPPEDRERIPAAWFDLV